MSRLAPLFLIVALAAQCSSKPSAATTRAKARVELPPGDPKVVMIVLDGIRTEEFFMGRRKYHAKNFSKRNYKGSKRRMKAYKKRKKKWRRMQKISRKYVMPFVWRDLAKRKNTKVFGNRFSKKAPRCYVNNKPKISMPAYADLLGGRRQSNVKSNRFRGRVKHPTIIDQLISKGLPTDQIAVFASWRHIGGIVSQKKTRQFHIDTGRKTGDRKPPWSNARYDVDMMRRVVDYLNSTPEKPHFLFVAFNDSDEWAHKGNYKRYIEALTQQDKYIRRLFQFLESDRFYRGNTTYVITTDHGRGKGHFWKHHIGQKNSKYIWAVVNMPRPYLRNGGARIMATLQDKCSHAGLGRFAYRVLEKYRRT